MSDDPLDPNWLDTLARVRQRQRVEGAPDGIRALNLPHMAGVVLIDAGLDTIAKIQRHVADDTIGDLPRIGKGREQQIREALARWGQEQAGKR